MLSVKAEAAMYREKAALHVQRGLVATLLVAPSANRVGMGKSNGPGAVFA